MMMESEFNASIKMRSSTEMERGGCFNVPGQVAQWLCRQIRFPRHRPLIMIGCIHRPMRPLPLAVSVRSSRIVK